MEGWPSVTPLAAFVRPSEYQEYNHSTEHRTQNTKLRKKKEEEEEKTRKEENNRLEMVPQTRTPYAPVAPPRLRPLETRKDQIKYSQNEERKN